MTVCLFSAMTGKLKLEFVILMLLFLIEIKVGYEVVHGVEEFMTAQKSRVLQCKFQLTNLC